MSKIKVYVTLIAFAASVPVFADSTTKIDGKTFQCTNACSINSGPPMTVEDCCGGTVSQPQREPITVH